MSGEAEWPEIPAARLDSGLAIWREPHRWRVGEADARAALCAAANVWVRGRPPLHAVCCSSTMLLPAASSRVSSTQRILAATMPPAACGSLGAPHGRQGARQAPPWTQLRPALRSRPHSNSPPRSQPSGRTPALHQASPSGHIAEATECLSWPPGGGLGPCHDAPFHCGIHRHAESVRCIGLLSRRACWFPGNMGADAGGAGHEGLHEAAVQRVKAPSLPEAEPSLFAG